MYVRWAMCGIFGIFGNSEAANLTYLGLHALQHRGQESAGIVSADGRTFHVRREMGLVQDVFGARHLEALAGRAAIGHVRYSTSGVSQHKNAQPLTVEYSLGKLAVAHNGNLTNAPQLRAELEQQGAIFGGDSDTEVIIHLMARSRAPTLAKQMVEALGKVQGSYSLLFLTPTAVIAVRDPRGFRPLVIGKLRDATVFASETTALDLVGATFLREVEPGEMVVVDDMGMRSSRPFPAERPTRCVFEHVYFAKPDSDLFGASVYMTRQKLGMQLALEQPAVADLVIGVPDSGIPAAIGYSKASGIPYDVGLIRSHYVGRTFIEPQQSIRHFGVKLKLAAVREVLKGKRVVVVDDSLIRGTTSRKIVTMIKAAGASEVHLRISSPPTRWPCYYGIDTPRRAELIAATQPVEDIARFVTADSLGYLSVEGLGAAVGDPDAKTFCMACFTGKYPTPIRNAEEEAPPRSAARG